MNMPVISRLKSAADADQRSLRNLMGQFATGVTVITTVTPDGRAIGLTANSFSSVSLEPALVLWSLDRRSPNLEIFKSASHFAINILGAGQQELSNRFARPAENKFEGVDAWCLDDKVMVLEDSLATLVCRNTLQYEGGDHLIFIGEIERYDVNPGQPLVFQGGQYQSLQISI